MLRPQRSSGSASQPPAPTATATSPSAPTSVGALVTWVATVCGEQLTPNARGWYANPVRTERRALGASRPVRPVRTQRGRLVRVARTYRTEAQRVRVSLARDEQPLRRAARRFLDGPEEIPARDRLAGEAHLQRKRQARTRRAPLLATEVELQPPRRSLELGIGPRVRPERRACHGSSARSGLAWSQQRGDRKELKCTGAVLAVQLLISYRFICEIRTSMRTQ